MLLALDVGNTQTVLGVFEGEKLRGMWRIATDPVRTADELALTVGAILRHGGYERAAIRRVVVGSVVPPVTDPICRMSRILFGADPLLVDARLRLNVALGVREPGRVGADRLANACAARALHGAPVLVVDLGTATTFDVVDAAGSYVGGVIMPGLRTGAESLVQRTSRLPRVDLVVPTPVIGHDTDEAMRSGILWGNAMAIDGFVRRIRRELGSEAFVVATGGDAPIVIPLTETVTVVEPHLTLIGLRLIHELNAG